MSYMNGGFYQPQFSYMRCRPVSSVDEAKVAQVDFDGTVSVFPDIGHSKIYTKQIMLDGTAQIKTYSLVEEPKPPEPPEYITKDEFNSTITELRQMLSSRKETHNEPSAVYDKPNDVLTSF